MALTLLAPLAPAAAPPPKPVLKLTPIPSVGPSPITPDCRYLFVVDTSAAMQRSADGLYRATHRLVATGLGGRMQEGDVFTVWTYADTVLTREFPLNAWTRDLNIALANRTYEFLAQQKFRGKSNLRPVFAELGQALAITTNLTVVLVSDGTDVVVGTPFDRPINVLYGKRASEMRSAKMPFLTALVTAHGEFTHWSVRGGLEDLGLPFPEPPLLPVPAPVLPPAVVTPAPIPIPVVFTPPPPPTPAMTTNVVTKPAPAAVTNAIPVVAKAPEAVVPKPAPAPPPAPPAAPKAVTNAVAIAAPIPKPTPPPAPAVVTVKKAEPVPPPVLAPSKPVVTTILTNAPAAPVPAPSVAKPKETLVTLVVSPPPPTLIVPTRDLSKHFTGTSNAPVKVELLRPPTGLPGSSTNPLAARVIPPQPAPPKATNTTAVTAQPTPPSAPAAKPITNSSPAAPPAPEPVHRVVPVTPPPAPKPPEQKVIAPATNPVARPITAAMTNVPPPPKVEARTAPRPVAVPSAPTVAAPKPIATEARKLPSVPEAKTPAVTNQPAASTGPLAVTSGLANKGGWAYLAAAIALLVLAGGIIAHLLRPQAQPSAISQSLDDQRS